MSTTRPRSITTPTPPRVNYTLKLSDEAGECSGSSQHSRLSPAGGAVKQSGAQKVPVPANQVIEPNEAMVTVHKDYSDDNPTPVSVALECTDGTVTNTPQNASDEAAGGSPAVFTVTGFDDPNATCTTTETVPSGYTASGEPEGTCQATLGGACTITNTLNQATVTVHKDYSDDNPTPVSVALECTDGTVTNTPQNASDEAAGGSPAVFTVTGFDDPNATCTATETVPSGYTASGEPEGTCQATLGGACTITNTLNQATVTVHKDYSDDNPTPVSVRARMHRRDRHQHPPERERRSGRRVTGGVHRHRLRRPQRHLHRDRDRPVGLHRLRGTRRHLPGDPGRCVHDHQHPQPGHRDGAQGLQRRQPDPGQRRARMHRRDRHQHPPERE